MRSSARVPCLAIGLLLQAQPVLAQGGEEEEVLALVYGDKSTISIATGLRQPLRRAPAVATVITAQDIAAMGAVDLDELMESVPGVHVGRSNQGLAPLYYIRGIASEFNPQTLMLQNGVPMTTLFVGNRGLGWGGLPLENIARIEVIRGPGSALYGADAFSGVINIVTKTAADALGTEFGLRTGSFHAWDGWIQHGGRLGPLSVAAYLRIGTTDGDRRTVAADAQTALDALFGTAASLAPGPVNNAVTAVDGSLELDYRKLTLRVGYKLRDHMGTGMGVASALDPAGKLRTDRLTIDASCNDIEWGDDWRLGLAASYLGYVQRFGSPLQLFPPGAFGGAFPGGMFGAPNTWERQLRASAHATYIGRPDNTLRLGLGHDDLNLYRTQEFKNFTFVTSGPATGLPIPTAGAQVIEFPVEDSFLMPQRRTVNYVYLQDEWTFAPDWTLTAGVRHDRYSDFGGTTNPRLALVWDAGLDLTAKLLFGRAFRAPAFTEEYSINNPVYRGNPDLKPETIRTLEAALSWQARADTRLNLSLFRYTMADIIRTTSAANGTVMFGNIGSQHGHGLELEALWEVGRSLRLDGSYAWQRSIDDTTGGDAGYAPHHHLFVRADWSFAGGWLLGSRINHVAGRKRASGDARPDMAGYTTADFTLRATWLRNGWEFAASVRNLFNADVREPSLAPGTAIPGDIPVGRRSLFIEARYRL